MFNLSGSEIIFLLLMGLVVLGPDRLPDAVRRIGKTYGEFKKMTTGFQQEMRSALDEPMRELRETANLAKNAATFDINASAAPSQFKPVTVQPEPTKADPAPVTPIIPIEEAIDDDSEFMPRLDVVDALDDKVVGTLDDTMPMLAPPTPGTVIVPGPPQALHNGQHTVLPPMPSPAEVADE